MTIKTPLEIRRKSFATTLPRLYHQMQSHIEPLGGTVVRLDHGRWGVMVDNQLRSTFLLKNSKNWVNDPKAVNLIGRFDFRSWHVMEPDDLNADVDFFVFATTQREPEKIDIVVLTKDEMLKFWNDPRRKAGAHGSKFFYFSRLLTGRFGDSRFAKSAKKDYAGWVDLDTSALNNYKALVTDHK